MASPKHKIIIEEKTRERMRNLVDLKLIFSTLACLWLTVVDADARQRQIIRSEYAASNLVEARTYLIKFLTPRTVYPIKLVDHTTPVPNRHVKWLKYGSSYYIDQLDQHQNYFRMEREYLSSNHSSTSGPRTNLVILNYDGRNNFILDHYEPKHEKPDETASGHSETGDDDEEEEDPIASDRNIYTLVYLKSFELIANETGDGDDQEIHFGCKLRLVVPNGIIDQHTVIISERLEELVHLKLSVVNDKGEKHLHKRAEKNLKRSRRDVGHGMMTLYDNQQSSTLFELEMFEGPITIKKYDVTDLTTTCRLILKDYDGSTSLDASQTKRIVNSPNTQASTTAGAEALSSPSKLFLINWLLVFTAFYLSL